MNQTVSKQEDNKMKISTKTHSLLARTAAAVALAAMHPAAIRAAGKNLPARVKHADRRDIFSLCCDKGEACQELVELL